ncbi:MAG TPA: hypothetical protein VGX70_11325 [Gemmataceae bacterium]|jgi:hypothetical protein|nr:hypothetical protein [Gemmataceae bacterium]
MNSMLRKPALAALAIAVLVATAGSLLLRGSDKTSKQTQEEKQTPISKTDPVPDEQPPQAGPTAIPAEDLKADRRRLLETVGALTAAHCYQTYINIGLIADGKTKGTYSNQDAHQVLDSILSLQSSIDRNLASLTKLDLDKRDLESLEQMRDLSALLRQQGKDLKAFWDSGKEEDAARYDDTRKDSWAAIGRLTGIGRK